jgi:TPR repeat protein
MADLARDASGPASSEPAGIDFQQASRPSSSDDRGKLRVFISYSREDLKFADQLDAALSACGFECLIDRHGISGGEDWKRRLGNLITEADTVVFVLSPSSARSPICDWEVEEAARLNKRILPVNCRPLEGASPPPRLRELNYIFFYEEPKLPGSGFGTGLANLIAALNTDFDWLREHTRYLQRAMEWEAGGRPANRLLSGNDIRTAKAWAAARPKSAPEPTALQLDFIHASEEEAEARLSEQRKQLEAMSAAQAERETALHEAEEALKQAADAQREAADALRRRARIRNIALVAVGGLAAVAVLLALLANQQRITAEKQRQQADAILAHGATIIGKLQYQMDSETKHEAFALFQAGAEHGNASSMGSLGIAYGGGYGVPQDYAKAREWFEKAAAKDNAGAMFSLGVLYHNGQGVPQDYAKAREWYEKAAAKDVADAMFNLSLLYHNGQGVPQDYVKAREWYEKAAAKDVADAMTNLGWLYKNGQGVPQDYAKAREWYEKAAAKDSAAAMYNLGVLFGNGEGVPQDYAKAREWYEKAAAKDDANAMFKLGILYASGQDYTKAREWFQKAAAKDDARAMFILGALYAEGKGVPQDYVKAREWFENAAANDSADAMSNLGLLYQNGQGVAQDYTKAREWYEKAAANDSADAMNNLGALYQNGYGVALDYVKAREWFEKAAAQGNGDAKTALEQLPIHEAETAGRYAEALRLEEAFAAKLEAQETKRDGKPGEETAGALTGVIWYALFAKDFTKALTVADHAHTLFPNNLMIETNRAHALMFMRHDKEAKALYLDHKGQRMSGEDDRLWEHVIGQDFAEFRKAGLTHPMMADVEKKLGISR